MQYINLTRESLIKVLSISNRLIDMACFTKCHAYLDLAIMVFNTLAVSLEKISVSCAYELHSVLHFSSGAIFSSLASFGNEKETTALTIKFAKCCSPLLVDRLSGYPQSLLHIALSSRKMLPSPLLQTFLHAGGDRWINTPGVNGRRPLHLGVPKEVEVLLIDYGAHLDAVDAGGSTPRCGYKYYKHHPRPLSCIVARFIVKTGGLMEHAMGLLPTHIQDFLSLHDQNATQAEVDSTLNRVCRI